jgi:hypothetical protein
MLGATASRQETLRTRLVQSPLASRLGRVLKSYAGPAVDHHDRLRVAIPLLIAVASIGSAFVGWRAAEYSSEAGELDRRASQALIRERQITTENEGALTQDLRLFAAYQQHVLMRRLLERDAARTQAQDPSLAAELRAEAQSERAAARALLPRLGWYNPEGSEKQGIVRYDLPAAREAIVDDSEELSELRPQALAKDADEARTTSVHLFGVVTLFIASLFFLTLAQLGRAITREIYAGSGMAVLVVAVLLFHWVGP